MNNEELLVEFFHTIDIDPVNWLTGIPKPYRQMLAYYALKLNGRYEISTSEAEILFKQINFFSDFNPHMQKIVENWKLLARQCLHD